MRQLLILGLTTLTAMLATTGSASIKEKERLKVAIMLFPGVQIIDYTGPYEVLGQAGYDVFTVSAKPGAFKTNMNMEVIPTHTFANCPKPDIIVLPGGNVPQQAEAGNAYVDWVKRTSPDAKYTMSVCNGAFWLANAGLLEGKKATTYYGMLDALGELFPKVEVVRNRKFVDNGNVICTAGLSSGIEGALHLVERIDGRGKAKGIAMNMEYNWQPDSGYARGNFADLYFRRATNGAGFNLPDPTQVTIVDVEASASMFDKTWDLSDCPSNCTALMSGIKGQLDKTWKLAKEDSGEIARTEWAFKGEAGEPWSAVVSLAPVKDVKGKFTLRLTIRRESA